MKSITSIFFILMLVCSFTSYSQDQLGEVEDKEFERSGPNIPNTPLPKGFLATYRVFAPFPITSIVEDNDYPSPGKGKVTRLEENEYKIKIPVVLRDYTNFIIGAKYRYEEYHFEQKPHDYPLYRDLDNKHLNYLSLDFYLDHKLIKNRFATIKAGVQLIGDYQKDDINLERFLKYTLTGGFGWKKTEDYSIGFGIYANYIYGSPSIYPVFIFNRAYGEHWALQMALPASIRVHYRIDDFSILTAGVEFDGASYTIAFDNPSFKGYEAVELTRSDLLVPITYEREIYNFIWMTISAGYRYNVGFNINDGDGFNAERLLENKITGSPFVTAGLFLTLPHKYRKEFLNSDTSQ